MRHQGTENAALMLQLLQYDYADGAGDYGPVITEFSALLARYRQAFSAWQPMHEKGFWKKASRFLPMLKTAAMAAAAFALVTLFFPGGWAKAIFYIAAGGWSVWPPGSGKNFTPFAPSSSRNWGTSLPKRTGRFTANCPF